LSLRFYDDRYSHCHLFAAPDADAALPPPPPRDAAEVASVNRP
jgi:hypothetical protein